MIEDTPTLSDESPAPLPPSVGAGGERALARRLAPLSRAVRHMRYMGKWVVLGILIGVVAGAGAIVFYNAIALCQTLFQGGIAGYTPPGSGGREGPTAQISAGFGSFLGRVLRLDVQDRRCRS